jgi:hypothetical protein
MVEDLESAIAVAVRIIERLLVEGRIGGTLEARWESIRTNRTYGIRLPAPDDLNTVPLPWAERYDLRPIVAVNATHPDRVNSFSAHYRARQ